MISYSKEHYKKNKQVYKDRNQKRRREKIGSTFDMKRWLVEYKSSTPCKDCGQKYPHYVMDFDHTGLKVGNVSRLVGSGMTAKARIEIEKCDLVCSNCHRCRTYNRRNLPVAQSLERRVSTAEVAGEIPVGESI